MQELCRNCAFPQNIYTRMLGAITVFYAVFSKEIMMIIMDNNKKHIFLSLTLYWPAVALVHWDMPEPYLQPSQASTMELFCENK